MGTQLDLLCDEEDDEDEDEDDEMNYSLAPLQDHNETICVMSPSNIRENIRQSNMRKAPA